MDCCRFALHLGGLAALLALALTTSPAHADPINLVALGDSLTDTYKGKPYSGNNLNWVDQLTAQNPGAINIIDLAKADSTSDNVLNTPDASGLTQVTHAASLIHDGKASFATLIVGANDLDNYLASVINGGSHDPTAFVNQLVGNVQKSLDALQAAGKVGVVLGNVPDIGVTPAVQNDPLVQQALAKIPNLLSLVTAAAQQANAQLEALATARKIPLVDLYALNNIPKGPPQTIGGTDIRNYLYGPDGFHPSTVGQAMLADSILEALRVGYGVNTTPLKLSDSYILAQAHLSPNGNTFNPGGFVKFPASPEPSTLVLLGLGALGLAAGRRRP